MKRIVISVIVSILTIGSGIGQSFERSYEDYLAKIRPAAMEGIISPLPYDLLREKNKLERVLPAIDQSLSDSLVIIRQLAYQSLDVLHQVFEREIEHQQILGLQFKGLEDEVTDIQVISLDNISKMDPSWFTVPQKNKLIQMLRGQVVNGEVLIELVGKLGDLSAISAIKKYSQPGQSPKLRWAAYLALARLGDYSAIATINDKVRNLDVNSDVVYNIVPGLIYTQQKELYDYLVEELNSEKRNCEPADPDQTRPINCAYRILEMLAPKIEDFPIGVSASGDLDTRNYKQALQVARDWFAANPNYKIVEDSE